MLTIHEASRDSWLPFGKRKSPTIDDFVPVLVRALDGKGWRTAKELASELRTDDRTIRGLANASRGQVIGGQKGYCLTAQATVEDVAHAERFLLSQARAMTERARQIRIARNR